MTLSDYMSKLPATLVLHVSSFSKVDSRTQALRFSDRRMTDWSCLTQAWAWEGKNGSPGGDALLVLTGTLGRTRTYAAIRIGDYLTVQEIDGGIAGWFKSWDITVTVKSPYDLECAA